MASSESFISQEMLNSAKSYLKKSNVKSGLNLYEHISQLLRRLLDERPENAVDIFEHISKQQKRKTLDSASAKTGGKSVDRTIEFAHAEIQQKLFAKDLEDPEANIDDNVESPLPNLPELFYNFEQAGIGIGREELIRIWLALKNLVDSYPLQTVRFWGKVFGLEQNYIVAETEYREGEEEEPEEQAEELKEEEAEEEKPENEDEGVIDDTPKPVMPPTKLVPKEINRTGANKKTYFVCHEPGKPWIKLPAVTPQQIVASRQIKKLFTGRLDAPILSFPPFNGTEANYLRAQIARISAGTHISPAGFYKFDEDEETEEEGVRDNYVEDLEYEPKNLMELLDPSLHNWVHHVLNILPQGRCKWVNPSKKGEDEAEEEEEEENGVAVKMEVRPEIGPPLLNPLSEDISVEGTSPWSMRISSKLFPHYAVAVVRSNLWPGAYAFAKDKKFENIYIGWGHKFSAESYDPSQPAAVQDEFIQGLDLVESEDPSPDQEAVLKAEETEGGVEEEAVVDEDEEEEDN